MDDGWMDRMRWMMGWMEWMDGWMDDGWMMDGGWMVDGWMDGWMDDDGWRMDGWMDDWMDGWMDGWMEEWMMKFNVALRPDFYSDHFRSKDPLRLVFLGPVIHPYTNRGGHGASWEALTTLTIAFRKFINRVCLSLQTV